MGVFYMGSVNVFVVFIEGLLSLFSPCVLSILPVYLAILSGSSIKDLKEGEVGVKNSPILINTILFVLGISTTFFILGSSLNALNQFVAINKNLLGKIGGIIIIIMGLFYSGYLNLPFLQREKKFNMEVHEMKPLTAYILGFTFSFGWTPCVGPMLASVLIMASSAGSMLAGNLLILVYTLGFTLPFLIIALFYDRLFEHLDKLKLHMDKIQKAGGALLIIVGLVMALGGIDNIMVQLKNIGKTNTEISQDAEQHNANSTNEENIVGIESEETEDEEEEEKIPAPDFTLVDQYGEQHTLSDYKEKVVFLNFWATWCPPCRMEMPYIEEIYNENNLNSEDVVILGVAGPNLGREGDIDHIVKFLEDEGYTFPVVFDEEGQVLAKYYIQSFPNTFIIDKEGNVKYYVPGAIDKETMESLINDAK